MVRPDYIFSYWIFFWYILYICKLIKYNPKIVIICGLIENTIILLLMFYYNTKRKLIYLFFIMMTILKIIPLYTIWDTKLKVPDIYFTFLLFMIYMLWMYVNKKTDNDFITNAKKLIIDNKNTLPGMQMLERLGL